MSIQHGQDKAGIGREIMQRHKAGDWDRGWAVVTDLVRAGATTIAVSGADQASVVFEATGDVEKINLADASVGLSVAAQKRRLCGRCPERTCAAHWPIQDSVLVFVVWGELQAVVHYM